MGFFNLPVRLIALGDLNVSGPHGSANLSASGGTSLSAQFLNFLPKTSPFFGL